MNQGGQGTDNLPPPPPDPREEGREKGGRTLPVNGVLLAVDAGLRTGIACFDAQGRLLWCRSHHLADMTRLKRWMRGELAMLPALEYVVVEGGGDVAKAWETEVQRQAKRIGRSGKIGFMLVRAEEWREALLHPRERVAGQTAKATALVLARKVAAWSMEAGGGGVGKRPVALRHDAAEAVMTGFYAVWKLEWLQTPLVDVLR